MNLELPIRVRRGEDTSGTPFGLLEQKRKHRELALIADTLKSIVHADNVLVEYPFGPVAQKQTGYMRFVQMRQPAVIEGKRYFFALAGKRPEGVELPQDEEFETNAEQAARQARQNEARKAAKEADHNWPIIHPTLLAQVRTTDGPKPVKLNLSAPGNTIDGVKMRSGDRVLVRNYLKHSLRGIYVWHDPKKPMTRATDAMVWDDLVGASVYVEHGSDAGSMWKCDARPGGAMHSSPILWSPYGPSNEEDHFGSL